MKLIIDIDEDIYKLFTDNGQGMKVVRFNLENALKNGTPLEEELEQIKEEIEDRYDKEMIKRHADSGYDYQDLLLVGIDIGKNIVDKHIVELKERTNDKI